MISVLIPDWYLKHLIGNANLIGIKCNNIGTMFCTVFGKHSARSNSNIMQYSGLYPWTGMDDTVKFQAKFLVRNSE